MEDFIKSKKEIWKQMFLLITQVIGAWNHESLVEMLRKCYGSYMKTYNVTNWLKKNS